MLLQPLPPHLLENGDAFIGREAHPELCVGFALLEERIAAVDPDLHERMIAGNAGARLGTPRSPSAAEAVPAMTGVTHGGSIK